MPADRKTIAIVDDDESIRRAIARQLRAAGYRCEAYQSAEDMLYCLTTIVPSGVLADIHLGAMSGLELAIHPELTRRNTPVVLMTGFLDPLVESSARQVAAGFLRKPMTADELLDTIIGIVGPPLVEEFEGLDGV
jgi:FixJ family two-component response regulator